VWLTAWAGIVERMQNIDIFRLVPGCLMSLFTIYWLVGLFPSMEKRQQTFERRIKSGGGTIIPMSRLRRAVGAPMLVLFAVQILADAFHCNLSTLTGISPSLLFFATFLPFPIFLLLGSRDKRLFRNKHGRDA
jgi:hypothetical protein